MSRRDAAGPADSLDLLLDAMCNTFGAIIFIALLLSVMSFFSKPLAPDARAAAEAIERARDRETRIAALELEIAVAETAERLYADARAVGAMTDDQRRRQAGERALRLDEALRGLEREAGPLRAAVARVDGDLRRTEAAIEVLERRQAAVERAERRLDQHLALPASESPAAPRHRVARLPVLRAADQPPFYVMMRWGRVFPLFRFAEDGELAPDDGSVKFDDRIDYSTYVQPIKGRGLAPGTAGRPAPGFAALVEQVRRSGRYIDFTVYGDSYAAFIEARNYIGGQGIAYNWEPIADDHALVLRRGAPNLATQ